MIGENLTSWLDHPVADYAVGAKIQSGTFYRFRESKTSITELFAAYTSDVSADQTSGLVIGFYDQNPEEVVQLLVGARQSLPNLEAIFFGDIISEETEISWLAQTDLSPLFSAYPGLKHFAARGSEGLSLGGNMRHESLESLTIETGGLPASVIQEVLSLDLPNLEKLELWLGTEDYGWDGSLADVQPLLDGGLFPKLKHLGLRNSQITDQIAQALVTAPVVERLETLDLSMGTLTDTGAFHLAKCQALRGVKNLILHHHYCTEKGLIELFREFPRADVSDQNEIDEYGPYVEVGE